MVQKSKLNNPSQRSCLLTAGADSSRCVCIAIFHILSYPEERGMSSRAPHSLHNGVRSFGLLITRQILSPRLSSAHLSVKAVVKEPAKSSLTWGSSLMTLAGYEDPEQPVIPELSIKVCCWWIKDEISFLFYCTSQKPQIDSHLMASLVKYWAQDRWRKGCEVVDRTEKGRMVTFLCSLHSSGRDNIFMGVSGVQGGWLNYSAEAL